ncbi:MAG: non-canonical purine NTP pyrophosphatase [Phycisphaerales bacterium]
MEPIVVATGNPHKVQESRAILEEAGVEVVGLRDLPGWERLREPVEHGRTFEENAAIKAISYARQTGRMCLADDSGLEVDALGGAPGVISSHYSSDGREIGLSRADRDAANNARLMRELERVRPEARTARFVCVMCLADARAVRAESRGTMEGRIGMPDDVPRGENGFGYDPLFLVAPDFTRTSAELEAAEKNRLSHRGATARKLVRLLRGLADA